MKRHYTLYIKDIFDAITKIEEYTKGMKGTDFLRDGKTQSAVAWKVMTIGEAAKHVPRSIRLKYKVVPWSDMAKMRDRITHTYFGVSYEIVWAVVKKELPVIKPMIKHILEELKGENIFE